MTRFEFSRRFMMVTAGVVLSFAAASQAAEAVIEKPAPAAAAEAKTNTAIVPAPREGKWMERHESMNDRVKKGNVDLIFIGDSITQGWESVGGEVWKKYYGSRNAVNLGISGDRTQHVLWRLEHGNIEGIKPKLAVIMIGTNNSNNEDNTVAEIAAGIRAIVKKLQADLPETKILLLGIFPRGQQPNAQRGKILQVNQIIAKLARPNTVSYMDIGPKFIKDDGSISKDVMPDFLHLTPTAYETWAKAIEPRVKTLMGEK